ncbi:hypothetical protein BGZ61DRAFT_475485 [Ilyonectria robusta]|uniref:uncharacterized protein n=1 Tax=Ilyonectria robusta TaxID=1079257 RepID=UPI001E8CA74E|nr:uncharacterized protein BGZ61DRAFT_475485 [Ilyonectria robusta]KAH8729927.1 hypothetical protein BGZ61DRAFT_475485 [Ilyonectria robusta]
MSLLHLTPWNIKVAILLSVLSGTMASIESTQPLEGKAFIGRAVSANPLTPKVAYDPASQTYHRDAGNTRSENFQGPLGKNTKVESWSTTPPVPMFWDSKGLLTAGAICREDTACIVSLNPDTFKIEATYPESGEPSELDPGSMVYMQLLDKHVTIPTAARHIIDVERIDNGTSTSFVRRRDIDLSDITEQSSRLIGSAYDGEGNLWFTTGYVGVGIPITDTAVIGYIEPKGTVHSIQLPNTRVENNFAISGTDVYLITGPAGAADEANATAYFYGFQPSADGVKVVMALPYESGDGVKLGGVSRGSGSTPALLGHKYVAYTDNANDQVNVHIVPQMPVGKNDTKPVCSMPLFEPGLSANENSILNHWDGDSTYSVVLGNYYNGVPIYVIGDTIFGYGMNMDPATINGAFNNINQMAPGLVRIDFNDKTGTCTTRWYNKNIRGTVTPILPTKTGLLYMPVQDWDLAREGTYVYYITAIDFKTGKEVWKIRIGAGGSFNYNLQSPVLTYDGGVGQYVNGGFVKVKDSR